MLDLSLSGETDCDLQKKSRAKSLPSHDRKPKPHHAIKVPIRKDERPPTLLLLPSRQCQRAFRNTKPAPTEIGVAGSNPVRRARRVTPSRGGRYLTTPQPPVNHELREFPEPRERPPSARRIPRKHPVGHPGKSEKHATRQRAARLGSPPGEGPAASGAGVYEHHPRRSSDDSGFFDPPSPAPPANAFRLGDSRSRKTLRARPGRGHPRPEPAGATSASGSRAR